FGETMSLPESVTKGSESISLRLGGKEPDQLSVDPEFFTLGDDAVTFVIKKKNGELLQQDATINVFAKNPEAQLSYSIIKEYPHDTRNFTQGLQLEGNTFYETDGHHGGSKIIKYELGTTTPKASTLD